MSWEVFKRPRGRTDQRRTRIPVGDGSEAWHGTVGGYCHRHCGCERCRDAWFSYKRAWYARRKLARDTP